MNGLYRHRYLIRRNLIVMIGICLSVYFSYHAIQGNRSYLRLMSLERDITETSAAYEALKNERTAIEDKVVMLRPGSINRDLLEERARLVLGYRHPDEMAIVSN